MKIGTKIILTEADRLLAKQVGKARFLASRDAGNKQYAEGIDYTGAKVDILGMAGEIAFCKLFDAAPDITVDTNSRETTKAEATLPNGTTVDIKTTDLPDGNLVVRANKSPGVDCYALMRCNITGWEFTFMGFAAAKYVHQESNLISFANGNKAYFIKSDNLLDEVPSV